MSESLSPVCPYCVADIAAGQDWFLVEAQVGPHVFQVPAHVFCDDDGESEEPEGEVAPGATQFPAPAARAEELDEQWGGILEGVQGHQAREVMLLELLEVLTQTWRKAGMPEEQIIFRAGRLERRLHAKLDDLDGRPR